MREVAHGVKLSSTQTVHKHLKKLEESGHVERDGNKARGAKLTERGWREAGQMPVKGRIAAGPGMDAVPVAETSQLASQVFGSDRYMLEARGQSMSGAGIEDGDMLIIVADPSPPDGTIVAALIGGERVTVKRLFREGENVRLRAENGEYTDIVALASQVEVQGRVELIVRKPWRK